MFSFGLRDIRSFHNQNCTFDDLGVAQSHSSRDWQRKDAVLPCAYSADHFTISGRQVSFPSDEMGI